VFSNYVGRALSRVDHPTMPPGTPLGNELSQRASLIVDDQHRRARTKMKETFESLAIPMFPDGMSSQSPNGAGPSSNDQDSQQDKLLLMNLLYRNLKRSANRASVRKR